ncbi:MAG: COX15/CtaA family protein [Chloroflexota bacterium]|nr:COX15/CtaA family protein [Chloroflexota bacterium]
MVSISFQKASFLFNKRFLKLLIVFSIIDCIFQISLGGFVRVTSSGLGCPDWPLCYGKIIPPMNYHTLIEWGHRTSGAILGLSILMINLFVFLYQRKNKLLLIMSSTSLFLVILVGGIGGAVVLTELEPSLRTLHLFLAQIIIFTLGISLISLYIPNDASYQDMWILDKYSIIVGVVAIIIIMALLTGSYAVWKGAGTVCSSWPLCTSGSILPKSGLGWIHMIHRITSSFAGILGLYAFYIILRGNFGRLIMIISAFSLLMIITQIILGALNPWTKFEIWARVSHLGISSVLWGSVSTLFCLLTLDIFRSRIKN